MQWLAVALGAALGAPMRFWTERRLIGSFGIRWPYGTLVVNLVGSLILGFLAGRLTSVAGSTPGQAALVYAFLGTGFCGALTTFSGFASQVLELSRDPLHWRGALYGFGSVIVGLALASIGFVFAASL